MQQEGSGLLEAIISRVEPDLLRGIPSAHHNDVLRPYQEILSRELSAFDIEFPPPAVDALVLAVRKAHRRIFTSEPTHRIAAVMELYTLQYLYGLSSLCYRVASWRVFGIHSDKIDQEVLNISGALVSLSNLVTRYHTPAIEALWDELFSDWSYAKNSDETATTTKRIRRLLQMRDSGVHVVEGQSQNLLHE